MKQFVHALSAPFNKQLAWHIYDILAFDPLPRGVEVCLYDGLHLQKNAQHSFKSLTHTRANSLIIGG
jgi:hypothetical protein